LIAGWSNDGGSGKGGAVSDGYICGVQSEPISWGSKSHATAGFFYDEYRRGLTLKTTRFCFQRSKLGRFTVEKPCTP